MAMPTVTTDEAKALSRQLEEAITQLLKDYTTQTGLVVYSLDVTGLITWDQKPVYQVKVEVHL
jgi:hypothetical protein